MMFETSINKANELTDKTTRRSFTGPLCHRLKAAVREIKQDFGRLGRGKPEKKCAEEELHFGELLETNTYHSTSGKDASDLSDPLQALFHSAILETSLRDRMDGCDDDDTTYHTSDYDDFEDGSSHEEETFHQKFDLFAPIDASTLPRKRLYSNETEDGDYFDDDHVISEL